MDSEQFNTLLEILETTAFISEMEAVNSRMQCQTGAFPTYEIKAQNAARNADMIHRAIVTLKTIREQKTPFEVATPIPQPSSNHP